MFLTLTSETAVQKATNIIVPIVASKIQGLRVPNQSGKIRKLSLQANNILATIFPNLYIDYQITNILLSSVSFGVVYAELTSPNGFTFKKTYKLVVSLTVPNLGIVTTMNWAYQMGND